MATPLKACFRKGVSTFNVAFAGQMIAKRILDSRANRLAKRFVCFQNLHMHSVACVGNRYPPEGC